MKNDERSISDWYIIPPMTETITSKTFDKRCPLLKIGYKITENDSDGIVLKNTGVHATQTLFLFVVYVDIKDANLLPLKVKRQQSLQKLDNLHYFQQSPIILGTCSSARLEPTKKLYLQYCMEVQNEMV